MKTCVDCIHCDVCTKDSYPTDINPVYIDFSVRDDVDKSCDDFKDKTKFIELPCPIGDTVYMVVNAYNTYDNVEYKTVIETSFGLDMLKSFNKRFFLTREEAEKKLEELR